MMVIVENEYCTQGKNHIGFFFCEGVDLNTELRRILSGGNLTLELSWYQ